jgi:hypothetical protein
MKTNHPWRTYMDPAEMKARHDYFAKTTEIGRDRAVRFESIKAASLRRGLAQDYKVKRREQ